MESLGLSSPLRVSSPIFDIGSFHVLEQAVGRSRSEKLAKESFVLFDSIFCIRLLGASWLNRLPYFRQNEPGRNTVYGSPKGRKRVIGGGVFGRMI